MFRVYCVYQAWCAHTIILTKKVAFFQGLWEGLGSISNIVSAVRLKLGFELGSACPEL